MNIFNPNEAPTHMKPIFAIQTYLRSISRIYPEIPSVVPDGIYGKETSASVRAFQELFGLPVTGEVDLNTWDLILFVYNQLEAMNQDPTGIFPYPYDLVCDTCVLKPCDTGDVVTILQVMLNAISDDFADFEKVEVTGRYDEPTARQVKTFQSRTSLNNTGLVDKATWNNLTHFYNLHAAKPINNQG